MVTAKSMLFFFVVCNRIISFYTCVSQPFHLYVSVCLALCSCLFTYMSYRMRQYGLSSPEKSLSQQGKIRKSEKYICDY